MLNVKATERKSRSSIPLLVFWVLIFDLLRITFSSGGDQQTTGPWSRSKPLYTCCTFQSRDPTRESYAKLSYVKVFLLHTIVFFSGCFGFSYFKWFWCLRFSSDKWLRPTDVWSLVLIEAALYLLDLTFARSHMWVLNYIKVFMLYTHMFYFTVVILHAS